MNEMLKKPLGEVLDEISRKTGLSHVTLWNLVYHFQRDQDCIVHALDDLRHGCNFDFVMDTYSSRIRLQ